MSYPSPSAYPVIVIGGGISGLACSYYLQQAGIPVRVLEGSNRPGGLISTKRQDGFLFELGPQSFLSSEALRGLIDKLHLGDQLLRADPRAPRYILQNGKLIGTPLAPPSLLTTPLFSAGTKWRLLTEILRRTTPPSEEESVAEFVRRKFGKEILERLVAPFISGIYAGDPERLSLPAAFPTLHEFEAKYGSVLRGAMKSRPAKGASRGGLCAFRDGMDTLPRAIAARLGDSLLLETRVAGLRHAKANGKAWFEVDVQRHDHRETMAASAVIVATPTEIASQILAGMSDQLTALFSRIEYAPLAVVSAGYRREQFDRVPQGFGFLVPRSEGLRVLGTVFNSALFAGRAAEGMVCLTSFAGGATDLALCQLGDQEITKQICSEVARVLGIGEKPVTINLQRYARALPQYNLGHPGIVKRLEAAAAATPGLFLAGNYLSGPSIGSCLDQANRTADGVRVYLASIGVAGAGAIAHA